jgi:tryptophan synthase alpha chain
MGRLQRVALAPREQQRLGFGLYLIPGFPDWDTSREAVKLAIASGVDFIEFPILRDYSFSPRTGQTVADALRRVGHALLHSASTAMQEWLADVPVPVGIVHVSAWPHARDWSALLPLIEHLDGLVFEFDARPFADYAAASRTWDVPLVAMVSATTPMVNQDEAAALRHGGGFVYLALGRATGQPPVIGDTVQAKVRAIRGYREDLPIYAAFGIRTSQDLAAVSAAECDGFIVGSHALHLLDQGLGVYQAWLEDIAQARQEIRCAALRPSRP